MGFSLIPRFLTEYAYGVGTLYILLFWIPLLVIFPDIIRGYETKITTIKKFPKFTIFILLISIVIVLLTLIYKDVIYNESSSQIVAYLRRSLYLVHPLICLSLLPFFTREKMKYSLLLLGILTALMIGSMLVHNLLANISIIQKLNNLTAQLSAIFITIFSDVEVNVNETFLGNEKFLIEVKQGCSSLSQIILSINSMFVFYLCCKIRSKFKIIKIIGAAILLSFVINSARVAMLCLYVEKEEMRKFDFWHTGAGSLIFSLIVMSLASYYYYCLWCKENPISSV